MNFSEYQTRTGDTAIYKGADGKIVADLKSDDSVYTGLAYIGFGLASEVGELLSVCKKIIRDRDGVFSESDINNIKAEISDIFWYLGRFLELFRLDGDETLQYNLDKLASRKARNTISGSGDHR